MGRRARSNTSSVHRLLIIGCTVLTVLLVASLIILGILTNQENTIKNNIHKAFTVEAGSTAVDPNMFLVEPSDSPAALLTEITEQQLNTPGRYPVELYWQERVFDVTLIVADTTPPSAEPVSVTALVNAPDPATLVTNIVDFSTVTVTYINQPNMSVAGTYPTTVRLTDSFGNHKDITAELTVIVDTVAPNITGVKPIVIYLGDAVSYRSGVTVTDDYDKAPVLTINSKQVKLDTVGTYTVIYTAKDASGNETAVETTIRVMEKQVNSVPIETINEAADQILAGIIKNGMSKKEQVRAIYKWVQAASSYSGHSDKSDYMQGAYIMMTEHKGDCFNYFAVTKLMFDRLGIDNIDVRKVKNYPADSDHYWSLVSLDGGQTWYHFDATPRVGDGDNFCLVTDAFLDAYSAKNNNCHNRDKSLYPATPKQ